MAILASSLIVPYCVPSHGSYLVGHLLQLTCSNCQFSAITSRRTPSFKNTIYPNAMQCCESIVICMYVLYIYIELALIQRKPFFWWSCWELLFFSLPQKDTNGTYSPLPSLQYVPGCSSFVIPSDGPFCVRRSQRASSHRLFSKHMLHPRGRMANPMGLPAEP